jgi:serine/threonine-protein kinase
LYEMLTGGPPHTGGSAQSILGKILLADVTRPTKLRHTIPANVEGATLKALERIPADRFGSAAEFSTALKDRSFRHGAIGAGEGAPWISQRASKLTLAAALILAVWAVMATLRTDEAQIHVPTTRVGLDEDLGQFGFALSDDGRWLGSQPDPFGPVLLRRLDREGHREIIPPQGTRIGDFSPEGRWLLMGGSGGLYRLPVEEAGPPVPLVTSALAMNADWGEEGDIVYCSDDGMYTVPWSGGDPRRILDLGFFAARHPRFLPGGRHVVYTRGSLGEAGASIHVLDLETGENRLLVENGFSPQYVPTGHLIYAQGDQTLSAVPFDPRTLELRGQPRPVADSVAVDFGLHEAIYRVSEAGTALFQRGLAYEDEPGGRRFSLVDLEGRREVLPMPPGSNYDPSLSPDGRHLAYLRGNRVYLYDLLTGHDYPLSPEGEIASWPAWNRGGTRVAYFSVESVDWGGSVMIRPASGGGPPVEVAVETGALIPSSWTPGDDAILVTFNYGDKSDLALLRLGPDTVLVPYLQADWNEHRPTMTKRSTGNRATRSWLPTS